MSDGWHERDEWDRRSDEEWNDAWEEQDFNTFDNRYAAGGVRFRVREAVEPLTGEAGLLGLTCGCEHCIVAQMLFRGGGCRRWMEWREQHGARAALLRSLRHSLSVSHRVSAAGTVRNMLP